ncbi:MAG: ABC transporter ATP-binding protein [Lachnospiraceae bacterium]|nr:ABC transporter ATP-binding protein [Lachnospiraceae bacterium]
MSEYAIEVNHLTKSYKLYANNKRRIIEGLVPGVKKQHTVFNALNDVSFKIGKGEIIGIIGKNGSGKSTLLKIITGVLQQSAGEVKVNGRISALLELGAGFNPEYTGIENIYLNGTLNRIPREEMSKRINDIAEFADIGEFIHQPVKSYSSGMFVRLAFAVAVYSEPDILIVDEALAVGDAAFQAKCMARMTQIMKSGATVLFVTHDMNTVKRLCQRCIYLENGTKIMEGPAAELADIYLKRIRASMNEEHVKILEIPKKEKEIEENNRRQEKKVQEYLNTDFIERTKYFKEGNGDVEFVNLQLLNSNGEEQFSFEFDEEITIRMRLKVNVTGKFGVGYHIRDDKNTELLGSTSKREIGDFIEGNAGEVYEIDFITRLPLIEGNYNITLVASRPVIENRTALFLALIENAAVFAVEENFEAKLWNKFYIKNEVKVKKLKV